MHHHFTYSESERRTRQNPEAILAATGLKKGMCFMDIGANDGFFTLPAARIVGDSGSVIAIDIDADALARLQKKLEDEQLTHATLITSAAEDIRLDDVQADVIFFGIVLHDFYDPLTVLKNAKHMLKEHGIIYNYDWRKHAGSYGPPMEKRLSRAQVKDLAQEAGLTVTSSTILDDHVYAMTLTR